MVFNSGAQFSFLLSLESFKLKLSAVPARYASAVSSASLLSVLIKLSFIYLRLNCPIGLNAQRLLKTDLCETLVAVKL